MWTDLAAEKAAAMSEGNAPTEEADGEEADEDEENDDDLFGDGDALYGGNEKVAEPVVDDAEEGKTEVDNKTEEEEEKEEEADTEEKAEE